MTTVGRRLIDVAAVVVVAAVAAAALHGEDGQVPPVLRPEGICRLPKSKINPALIRLRRFHINLDIPQLTELGLSLNLIDR